jgi:hypothetical protein
VAAEAPAEEEEALTPDVEAEIRNAVGPEVISSGATMGASLAASAIIALIAINYERNTMATKDEIHPAKLETDVSSVETKATDTEAALSDDSLVGNNSELKAGETEARVVVSHANVTDSGATGLINDAGALETKQKGLTLN